jgi:flagellar biosynthesis/type III secretory pathway chaperone
MADVRLTENLIKTLEYERRIYSQLLKHAEKKTEYLVSNDTSKLSEITEEEGKLVEQGKQLARVREQYATQLNQALGLDSNASLEEAEKRLSAPQAAQIADIRTKLKETLIRLMLRNGINQKLIGNAMEYINFNLELLAAPAPEAPVYGKTGAEVSSGRKRSMLDIRS